MKKSVIKLVAALAFVVAAATGAKAAVSQTINIVLNMSNLSVLAVFPVDGGTFTTIAGSSNAVVTTDRMIFQNDGVSVERFLVRLGGNPGPWNLIVGDATAVPTMGVNEYRMAALWHQFDVIPTAGEYQDTGAADSLDILTPGDQFSSLTKFFNDAETHGINGDNQAGSVPAGQQRSLYLRAELPATGSLPVQTNTIIVTAALP